MTMNQQLPFQTDLNLLTQMLERVILEQTGENISTLLGQVRSLAEQRRQGNPQAEAQLLKLLQSLNTTEIRYITRGLAIWFDLANLVEDRQRVRVLRERERKNRNTTPGESLRSTINELQRTGMSWPQMQELLDRLRVELVLTAHPTEAKRRTVRDKLARLREDLQHLHDPELLPDEQHDLLLRMQAELTAIWQTDLVRPYPPTVLDEVSRGLGLLNNLWQVVPKLYRELGKSLTQTYFPTPSSASISSTDQYILQNTIANPVHTALSQTRKIRYASWIGGDRDGHPKVTAQITSQTLELLRKTTIQKHLEHCRSLHRLLSLSDRHGNSGSALKQILQASIQRWPVLDSIINGVSQHELYRHWLLVIEWRLQQTQLAAETDLKNFPTQYSAATVPGAYAHAEELTADLELLRQSLENRGAKSLAEISLKDWLIQTHLFGFHGYTLDIRQESRYYATVIAEILEQIHPGTNYSQLDEADKCRVLCHTLSSNAPIDSSKLSEQSRETLALFNLLKCAWEKYGPASLGGHIISLTHHVSDVLTVLWFCHHAQLSAGQTAHVLPIIPLFETIDDLKRAPQILSDMLEEPQYIKHLRANNNLQIIMIGYSDSTKDGGYLAACWHLYQAQQQLSAIAQAHGIQLLFFHGRGGSLGRGGGPTARAILSLPPQAVSHGLRMTEQGEVLAERYDDPQIAYRHLEQVFSAVLLVSTQKDKPSQAHWHQTMYDLAHTAYQTYRQFIQHPGFMCYFESATPIQMIPDLQIGSRPSRRHGMKELSDLRAIPWVFSWTQSRQMIPAWYGLGTAIATMTKDDPAAWETLRQMYQHWPFFRATIDNAALALAKTDLDIARHYAQLTEDPAIQQPLWQLIQNEYRQSADAIKQIIGIKELLDDVPWLKQSISTRNPQIDPLNLLQVELLKRLRATLASAPSSSTTVTPSPDDLETLKDLLRLTIQGIASGMRTTG